MSARPYFETVRTPRGVIIAAAIFGAFGGLFGMVVGRIIIAEYHVGGFLAVMLFVQATLLFAVWLATIAVLCPLIAGVRIGGWFSYLLSFTGASVIVPLVFTVLQLSGYELNQKYHLFIRFALILVIGIADGIFWHKIARGYSLRSGVFAAIGVSLMLAFGWWMKVYLDSKQYDLRIGPLVTGIIVCIAFGGAIGAMIGALADRLTGRTWS